MSKNVRELMMQIAANALLVPFVGRAAIRGHSSDSIPGKFYVTDDRPVSRSVDKASMVWELRTLVAV